MTQHYRDDHARVSAIKNTRRFVVFILVLTMASIGICIWQILR